jgi:translation initiation factor IF-2
VLDIAELKRQMGERLRQKQAEQQGAGSSGGSHYRGNEQAAEYIEQQKQKATAAAARGQKGTVVKVVTVPAEGLTLRELASRLSMKVADVRAKLEELGETFDGAGDEGSGGGSFRKKGARAAARHRRQAGGSGDDAHLEADVIELLALELGLDVARKAAVDDIASQLSPSASLDAAAEAADDDAAAAAAIVPLPRAPVVCIMGHVDHGKTTLLDALRRANVAASEAGGITQKLSAFTVEVKKTGGERSTGSKVVFLDTPGHAAFSAMRSFGANATDVVVLVVALDDGVRPQTKEALQMALEAKSTVIVALNKVDRIANPAERKTARARVLAQLVDLGLVCEDYGGDAQVVEVSGRTGEGLDGLVESLLVQADMLELKAAAEGQAEATVLDANMEKGRGVVADVLVQWGRLAVGDPVVIGSTYGRVKAMTDDTGKDIDAAGPSTPVRLLGLRTVPQAGQELLSVSTEAKARQIAERRERLAQLKEAKQRERGVFGLAIAGDGSGGGKTVEVVSTSLKLRMLHNNLAPDSGVAEGDGDAAAAAAAAGFQPIVVSVLIKADGVGTLDALSKLVTGLAARTKDVKLQLADCAVGDITRSDVERAATVGQAVILGFNVGVADSVTRATAKELDVKIVRDTVIYRLEDELRAAMESHMPKERSLVREGLAVVQKVFNLKGKQEGTVAGLVVQSGTLRHGAGSSSSGGGGGGGQYVYRVIRGRATVPGAEELPASMLKRFKDTVHEVAQGLECGLALEGFSAYEEGDEVECLKVVWATRRLSLEDEG